MCFFFLLFFFSPSSFSFSPSLPLSPFSLRFVVVGEPFSLRFPSEKRGRRKVVYTKEGELCVKTASVLAETTTHIFHHPSSPSCCPDPASCKRSQRRREQKRKERKKKKKRGERQSLERYPKTYPLLLHKKGKHSLSLPPTLSPIVFFFLSKKTKKKSINLSCF